jgi:TonB family protein
MPANTTPKHEDAPALTEIQVLWGEGSLLHIAHIPLSANFTIGEALDAHGRASTDFLIGADTLGVQRLPIVAAGILVIPEGASGTVTHGSDTHTFAELAERACLTPYLELERAQQYTLRPRDRVRMQHKGFTFVVQQTSALPVDALLAPPRVRWRDHRFTLGSFAAHVATLLLFYVLPPHSAALCLDQLALDARYTNYLLTPDAASIESVLNGESPLEDKSTGGAEGKPHEGEAGEMGKPEAPRTKRHYAVVGPANNADPQLAHAAALVAAHEAGILGVLHAAAGAMNSPTSPFGKEQAIGSDAQSILGTLLGNDPGANFGIGGLSPAGPGRGGGGGALGSIGNGDLATIGSTGAGEHGHKYGRGAGSLTQRPPHGGPILRPGPIELRGSLSKEVIRRVIQRHVNEIRYCYEQGLGAHPDLEGRVAVKFIIGPSGEVRIAAIASSDLANRAVEACILGAIRRWSFPAPDGGGVVMVTYPFALQQAAP